MDSQYAFVIEKLQEALAHMEGMPVLPKAGTATTTEEHKAWMRLSQEIDQALYDAQRIAVLALPAEVDAVYQQVYKRWCVLINLTPQSLREGE